MNGKVYLIGAGPGDPGLLTIKGRECIACADVVVYDYLASPRLLAFAAEQAERIYVGKKGGDHTLSQDGINALLVEKAKAGNTVARLKGGDPFIFGRGGEEAEVLIKAGIPFEIVPGVTSAIAAPAYAGIPLTHRKFTSTLAFITGHEDPTKTATDIDWESLARGIGTLVFLMGVKNLPRIVEKLLEHGRGKETPAALVSWGTTARQKTVAGTLGTIVENVQAAGLTSPAVIIVGEVVTLRETMQWFENRPLMGKRILVTRARSQASDLVTRLGEMGADCIEYPTIRIEAAADTTALDRAIDGLAGYDWLVFTSVNGVRCFFEQLFRKGRDARALGHLRTAVIGPATARQLRDFGVCSDITPKTYRAESIVEAFAETDMRSKRVLLPRARGARPILPVELENQGAIVDEIITYEARPVTEQAEQLLASLREKAVDMVTFTSSSTVTHFRNLLPDGEVQDLMAGVTVASIGPITSDTARDLGFTVHVTADEYTIPGLCAAIVRHYAGKEADEAPAA
ncbi:MAG: uroporphyrinogen-III C-methyltransferase [Thermodesulfobacteriota bacterium]